MAGNENPEAKYSKEDTKSLETLSNWIQQRKREESKATRKSTHAELVARNNAKSLVVIRRESDCSRVNVVEKKQVRHVGISQAGRRQQPVLRTIEVRTSVPVKDFVGVGTWGA